MGAEIELVSDGDGLAVIGEAGAVERFLSSQGLSSTARDLGLPRLKSVAGAGSALAEAGSQVAANSGRWVKLTEDSAAKMSKFKLMKGSTEGVKRAVLTENGKTKGFLEIVQTPGSMMTNPALLTGAAGLMAQLAMQQAMDEITAYLATIDEKVDDVLRAQKDAVLADMIGVHLVIEDAMARRGSTGRVSETTWSSVQGLALPIASTQAYALRQLDALAEKLERKSDIGDLAKASKQAEEKVTEWLAVLARCFQLQDALAVLELDRVLDASPDELDAHRLGVRAARAKRQERIATSTATLMARMDAAAGTANRKVLMHPGKATAVVASSNTVAGAVVDFQGRLGIEPDRDALEARRWLEAVGEVRDRVRHGGAAGVGAAKHVGGQAVELAKTATGTVTNGVSQRVRRREKWEGLDQDR